jgi:hypothetical protein
MVHRTDIAGGRLGQASSGQASFGNDRMCRRALKWPLLETNPAPGPLPVAPLSVSQSGGMKCYLLTTAAPAVHPFHLHLPTP